MADNAYKKMYRKLSQSVLTKLVSSKVLDEKIKTNAFVTDQTTDVAVVYVIQDNSYSNKILINAEIEKKDAPSAFSPLVLSQDYQEEDAFLILEKDKSNASAYYPDKLIRLVEFISQNPDKDVMLVPVTILWGRAPENQDSWYKALMTDAWARPTGIKQAINIGLYGRDNYIEFHEALSLKQLLEIAKHNAPNFSPAHYVVSELNRNFNQYKEAILGPDLSDRRNVINQLLLTDQVKDAILNESIIQQISMLEAEQRAREYLEEIVSDFSYSTVRFAEIILGKLWTQLYDGIEIHNFELVRELSKDYALVYTPCHRSHIDYLLLSYVIFKQGLMVPHIAAGINLNMPIVGQLMRGAGAYFIRRSFNGNALYSSVFHAYVHSLIERNTPLEYFIEGGRSRTGLLLPAKKGMLAMTIQSHLKCAQKTKPIVFLPTYFGYEKLIEGSSYLDELGGKKKQAESLVGLLKSLKSIEKIFGKVHVNFGEPVFLEQHLVQHHAPKLLAEAEQTPESVKHTVNSVALNILENINKAVVVNPVNLLAIVLLSNTSQSLSQRDTIKYIEHLKCYLTQCAYDGQMKMTSLSGQEIIDYALELKQINLVEHDHERWLELTTEQAMLLKYFMNNILHVFILPSLVVHTIDNLMSGTNGTISIDHLIKTVVEKYPTFKEKYFLKWINTEIETKVKEILDFFHDQNMIELDKTNNIVNLSHDQFRYLKIYRDLNLLS